MRITPDHCRHVFGDTKSRIGTINAGGCAVRRSVRCDLWHISVGLWCRRGGQVTPIITTDDLANYTPIGPNVQIRSTRFSAAEQAALDRLVTSQLRASYHSGDPSVTSLAALYQLGTEQSTSRTDVVMLSTGVNHDTVVDLNQPLASGQGAILARRISIPKIAALNLTIVGLAQVDSALPPPSAEWPSQVLSFNLALCRASHAAHCRLFEMASPTQVLNPRKES